MEFPDETNLLVEIEMLSNSSIKRLDSVILI